MTSSETLGDALPKAIERCKEILKNAEEIGEAGSFLCVMIKHDIKKAEKATLEHDVVGMLRSYELLNAYKD